MITQACCRSFLSEVLRGVHQESDVYKIALYKAAASLSKNTTAYTETNEVEGDGYVAGGRALTGYAVALDGDVAVLDFDNPTWPASTIAARGALIYNASKANRAVAVLNFGETVVSTNGLFTVHLPNPTAETALIALSN